MFGFMKHNKDDCRPLSLEELAYFNGADFFNGEKMNICNQFLNSLYSSPEEIDLFRLFCIGNGPETKQATDDEIIELLAYKDLREEPIGKCKKADCGEIESILTKYTGLTLGRTKKKGLENMTYLEKFNAYYYYNDDTSFRGTVYFYSGIMKGQFVRLFYNDEFYGMAKKSLPSKNWTMATTLYPI